jgi:hypothetical protein
MENDSNLQRVRFSEVINKCLEMRSNNSREATIEIENSVDGKPFTHTAKGAAEACGLPGGNDRIELIDGLNSCLRGSKLSEVAEKLEKGFTKREIVFGFASLSRAKDSVISKTSPYQVDFKTHLKEFLRHPDVVKIGYTKKKGEGGEKERCGMEDLLGRLRDIADKLKSSMEEDEDDT